MSVPKKNISKLDFVESLLINASYGDKCMFCKYWLQNYDLKSLDSSMRSFFSDHCKACTHNFRYKMLKMNGKKEKYYWYRDEFKPLYEWEE